MPAIEIPHYHTHPQQPVYEYIRHAWSERDKLFGKFRDAYKAGNGKAVRRYRTQWFQDKFVKISCLYKAGLRNVSVNGWQHDAEWFDPFQPIEHVVDWWRVPKSSSGHRIVCDLSPHMKAAHYMIADALLAQFDVPGFIYNVRPPGKKGRPSGREALVAALLSKLRMGYTHHRIYDVRDCFQHVGPDALSKLPLPRRVYENTLNLSNIQFRHDEDREQGHFTDTSYYRDIIAAEGASEPTGLMPGSPCSNVILAYSLQDTPQPDPQDGCIFLYGDDLTALSRAPAVAEWVDQNLLNYFGQSSMGSLQLLQKSAGHLGYFEYLGYGFQHHAPSGSWEVTLSDRNWGRLQKIRTLEALKPLKPWEMCSQGRTVMRLRRHIQGFKSLTDRDSVLISLMEGGPDGEELLHRRTEQS